MKNMLCAKKIWEMQGMDIWWKQAHAIEMYYNISFSLLDRIDTSTGSHSVKTRYDENRAHKGNIKQLVMFKKKSNTTI